MDAPKIIKLPDDANSEPIEQTEQTEQTENKEDAFIINPIFEKKYLTIKEVLDCINHLSGVLLVNECYTSKAEDKSHLRTP